MSSPISLNSQSPSPSIVEGDKSPSVSSASFRSSSQPPVEGLYSINALSVSASGLNGASSRHRAPQSPEFLEFSPIPSWSPEIRTSGDALAEKISRLESSIIHLEHSNSRLVKKIDFLQKAMTANKLVKEESIVKPNLFKDKDL